MPSINGRRQPKKQPGQLRKAAFPIAGIGASAGGFDAFTQLLQRLPSDTDMAFVLVQHLDPDHESALTRLLSKATSMSMTEVTNNTRIVPNHVYVIPPNRKSSAIMVKASHPICYRASSSAFNRLTRRRVANTEDWDWVFRLDGNWCKCTVALSAPKARGSVTVSIVSRKRPVHPRAICSLAFCRILVLQTEFPAFTGALAYSSSTLIIGRPFPSSI